MKSLAIAERYGWPPYVAHQAYYSLVSREYEWELMPLAIDQGVGTVVWSPLAGGALTGQGASRRADSEEVHASASSGSSVRVTSSGSTTSSTVLEDIAERRADRSRKSRINWVLHRPTVASVVIGARTEAQLRENLGAAGWTLDAAHVATLDAVSDRRPIYPYWHQRLNPRLNTPPVAVFR